MLSKIVQSSLSRHHFIGVLQYAFNTSSSYEEESEITRKIYEIRDFGHFKALHSQYESQFDAKNYVHGAKALNRIFFEQRKTGLNSDQKNYLNTYVFKMMENKLSDISFKEYLSLVNFCRIIRQKRVKNQWMNKFEHFLKRKCSSYHQEIRNETQIPKISYYYQELTPIANAATSATLNKKMIQILQTQQEKKKLSIKMMNLIIYGLKSKTNNLNDSEIRILDIMLGHIEKVKLLENIHYNELVKFGCGLHELIEKNANISKRYFVDRNVKSVFFKILQGLDDLDAKSIMMLLNCKGAIDRNEPFKKVYYILLDKIFDEIEEDGESSFSIEFTMRLLGGISNKMALWYLVENKQQKYMNKFMVFILKCVEKVPALVNTTLCEMMRNNFFTSKMLVRIVQQLSSQSYPNYTPSLEIYGQLANRNIELGKLFTADQLHLRKQSNIETLLKLLLICKSQIKNDFEKEQFLQHGLQIQQVLKKRLMDAHQFTGFVWSSILQRNNNNELLMRLSLQEPLREESSSTTNINKDVLSDEGDKSGKWSLLSHPDEIMDQNKSMQYKKMWFLIHILYLNDTKYRMFQQNEIKKLNIEFVEELLFSLLGLGEQKSSNLFNTIKLLTFYEEMVLVDQKKRKSDKVNDNSGIQTTGNDVSGQNNTEDTEANRIRLRKIINSYLCENLNKLVVQTRFSGALWNLIANIINKPFFSPTVQTEITQEDQQNIKKEHFMKDELIKVILNLDADYLKNSKRYREIISLLYSKISSDMLLPMRKKRVIGDAIHFNLINEKNVNMIPEETYNQLYEDVKKTLQLIKDPTVDVLGNQEINNKNISLFFAHYLNPSYEKIEGSMDKVKKIIQNMKGFEIEKILVESKFKNTKNIRQLVSLMLSVLDSKVSEEQLLTMRRYEDIYYSLKRARMSNLQALKKMFMKILTKVQNKNHIQNQPIEQQTQLIVFLSDLGIEFDSLFHKIMRDKKMINEEKSLLINTALWFGLKELHKNEIASVTRNKFFVSRGMKKTLHNNPLSLFIALQDKLQNHAEHLNKIAQSYLSYQYVEKFAKAESIILEYLIKKYPEAKENLEKLKEKIQGSSSTFDVLRAYKFEDASPKIRYFEANLKAVLEYDSLKEETLHNQTFYRLSGDHILVMSRVCNHTKAMENYKRIFSMLLDMNSEKIIVLDYQPYYSLQQVASINLEKMVSCGFLTQEQADQVKTLCEKKADTETGTESEVYNEDSTLQDVGGEIEGEESIEADVEEEEEEEYK